MIKGVHHAGLTVRDLDRSIAFFHTAQSFTLVSRHKMAGHARLAALAGEAAEGGEVARLKGPTGFLELFCFGQDTSPVTRNEVYQPGLRHICLQAADGEALFDSFVASGAIEHGRPISLATGNLYAYVRDPEGNILELEGLPHAAALSCPPWMGHIALVSPW